MAFRSLCCETHIRPLVEQLSQTRTVYPGTSLNLVYEMPQADSRPFQNSTGQEVRHYARTSRHSVFVPHAAGQVLLIRCDFTCPESQQAQQLKKTIAQRILFRSITSSIRRIEE